MEDCSIDDPRSQTTGNDEALASSPYHPLIDMPLVFDSGGLLGDSPLASPWMLRSSKLKLSAVHT